MFERYTESARRAIMTAREEAETAGVIQTRHLLLGILRVDETLAARVLGSATLEELREELAAGYPEQPSSRSDYSLSPESKRALADSAEEADRCGSRIITPAHLLTGLLHENTLPAAALKRRGYDLARCRLEFCGTEPPATL